MKVALSLLLFWSLNPSSARADEFAVDYYSAEPEILNREVSYVAPEDVELELVGDAEYSPDASSIKILGRGVAPRRSDESIAIACVGKNQECDRLQFVYFPSATAPVQYLGTAFKIAHAPNGKLQRKTLKLAIQEYLDYHQTAKQAKKRQQREEQIPRRMTIATMLGGVAYPLMKYGYAAGSVALAAPAYALPLIILPGVIYFVMVQYSISKLLSSGLVASDVRFTEQGGWNWGSSPHRIRSKKFNELRKGLSVDAPAEYTEKYDSRYQRKKKRLKKQGVQF